MKKIYVLLFLLSASILSFAQQNTDAETKSVLEKCLDLPDLQQYFPKNSEGAFQQVSILQLPVMFPAGLSINKFGLPVLFQTRQEIKEKNPEAYLAFKRFEINGNHAIVVFDLFYSRHSNPHNAGVSLNLEKTENSWTITNSSVNNQ